VSNNSDCNDNNAAVHPGAPDVCNTMDDNCDGQTDENAITATVNPTGLLSVCPGTSITLTANAGLGISYQWKKGSSNIPGATNQTYTPDKAGNYKVAESNSFNCNATSASTTISSIPLPTATITSLGNLNICAAGSVNLQANSGIGLSYQWKNGSSDITGATNQTCTATTTGTYKVVVFSSSGCSKTSSDVTVTWSCKEGFSNSDVSIPTLSVYPNPNDGQFMINLTLSDDENQAATIQLMSMIGQIVYSEKTSFPDGTLKKEIVIDQSEGEGMYLVRVIVNDQIFCSPIFYKK
jgi:hypothetical protein